MFPALITILTFLKYRSNTAHFERYFFWTPVGCLMPLMCQGQERAPIAPIVHAHFLGADEGAGEQDVR